MDVDLGHCTRPPGRYLLSCVMFSDLEGMIEHSTKIKICHTRETNSWVSGLYIDSIGTKIRIIKCMALCINVR